MPHYVDDCTVGAAVSFFVFSLEFSTSPLSSLPFETRPKVLPCTAPSSYSAVGERTAQMRLAWAEELHVASPVCGFGASGFATFRYAIARRIRASDIPRPFPRWDAGSRPCKRSQCTTKTFGRGTITEELRAVRTLERKLSKRIRTSRLATVSLGQPHEQPSFLIDFSAIFLLLRRKLGCHWMPRVRRD